MSGPVLREESPRAEGEVRITATKPQERIELTILEELPQSTEPVKQEERYLFKFSVTEEVHAELLKVQEKFAGTEGGATEAMFERLASEYLRQSNARRLLSAARGGIKH